MGGKVDNLIAWDLLVKSKARGGLEIENLKKKNIAWDWILDKEKYCFIR